MKILEKMKTELENIGYVFEDNLILCKFKPHTAPVAHMEECHSGVITANYYFLARYFNIIDDENAKAIVAEIKKLQNTDEQSGYFGCMRWYREEPYISDTNGAFFVLLPLALTYKLCEKKLTDNEKNDINELLTNALSWFSNAAKGSLHYCNKIMSDGAMLALIADITGKGGKTRDLFWTKWHKYADENGWGWGENSSDCYSAIMLNALNAVIISTDGELKEKAALRREKLLSYILFHEGKEFVPSIRTYNFDGSASYGGSVYAILERHEDADSKTSTINVPSPLTAILLKEAGGASPERDENNTRCEHLFWDSYAYTWKGENVRLGSVNHFPVMPCSYQNQLPGPAGKPITYGLGWQTMPVSAMIEDKVGFLRIRSSVGGKTYSHPATDKHAAHLFTRVFEDGNTVTFSTISAQENNIAVVCRYANKIANTSSFLCDEWCIDGEIKALEAGGRKWFVASRKKSAVALLPLDGICAGETARKPMETYISESGNFKTVTTEFYNGAEKLIIAPRIESVWVIVALEDAGKAKEYLENIEVFDQILPNFEVILAPEYKKRKITVTDGNNNVELLIDSVNQYDF